MKRIILFFTALFLICSLTGCHDSTAENPEPGEPSDLTETVPPKEEPNRTDAQSGMEAAPPAQGTEAQPVSDAAEYVGTWYDEKLPYNELELNSDGTYSSALFGDGTFRTEEDAIILDSGNAEFAIQAFPDAQRLTYNNICYIRTPYPVPEVFLEEFGESEGIFITISYSECDSADIKYFGEDGSETPIEDKGARALCFSAVVQDLNTYPWYDGDDVLIFGGFYADNGFVSSITRTYTPFKIISIRYDPGEVNGDDWIDESKLVVRTEDGMTHDMCMTIQKTGRGGEYNRGTYSYRLVSDLFEGRVFHMNQFVGHKEPNITD